MQLNYPNKKRPNTNDPQKTLSATGSPAKSQSRPRLLHESTDQKPFKSQIIKPTYVQSPKKRPPQQNTTLYRLRTFSKQQIRTTSPQIRKQDIQIGRIIQSKSLHSSFELKPVSEANEQTTSNLNIQQQITKFPHYVSKSYLMIETKKKMLEAKHKIKLGKDCPILQNIQDSVNLDKTAFSRKMKLQLCRKGNYDLIGYLHRDIEEIHLQSPNASDSYRGRNVPYLLMSKYKDPYTLEKQQRIHKMQEIKRKLKAVRKNNLNSLSRKIQ